MAMSGDEVVSGVEYARVTATLEQPIERVWEEIARFGGLERWVDSVTDCVVHGEGVGSVRDVTRNGIKIRERLVQCDPDAHLLAYRLLPPHPLPAADVVSAIALEAVDPTRTRIVWRSQASRLEAPEEWMRSRIEPFYQSSLINLARLLATKH